MRSRATRVGILSDTHAYLSERVVNTVRCCDVVVHAGDIGHAGVLEKLHNAVEKVVAVRGNNDSGLDLEGSSMNPVPWRARLDLPGGILAIEHGHVHGMVKPDHSKLRAANSGARAVVYGHTHRQVIDRNRIPWVINPGAAGKTRTNGGPSCLILTASRKDWEFEVFRFPKR